MKQYCQHCKYHWGNFDYCEHSSNVVEERKWKWKSYLRRTEDLNKNNNCENYKRKWYKFWIKEIMK